jgi:hypothetical protein
MHLRSAIEDLRIETTWAEWFKRPPSSRPSPQGVGESSAVSLKTGDGICQALIYKTRIGLRLFPLLGERIKGEGGRKVNFISAGGKG